MAKKARDHFVQQQLIRQFAKPDGLVFCFDKKKGSVPDRIHGNHPRRILYRRGYYVDDLGDLDDVLYKPIEARFGPHLLNLIADATSAVAQPDARAAMDEWVAAQVTRSQQLEHLVRAYRSRFGPLRDEDGTELRLNSVRVDFFRMELVKIRRCTWRVYSAADDEPREFVLGDEPVLTPPPAWAIGGMYLVPLSPRVLIAGGTARAHAALRDSRRHILPYGVNLLSMFYSHRYVYARRLLELDVLSSVFSDTEDDEHGVWKQDAREPHFGLERIITQATNEELDAFRRERESQAPQELG